MSLCPLSPELLSWWLLQCFQAMMLGLHQSHPGCPVPPSAAPVGRGCLLDRAPRWMLCLGTAVTAASSVTSTTLGACGGAWHFTCPFILAGARVLMRGRHLHAPSKVPFTLPSILCGLQGGLCNLCWQLGSPGLFEGCSLPQWLCPPQP